MQIINGHNSTQDYQSDWYAIAGLFSFQITHASQAGSPGAEVYIEMCNEYGQGVEVDGSRTGVPDGDDSILLAVPEGAAARFARLVYESNSTSAGTINVHGHGLQKIHV